MHLITIPTVKKIVKSVVLEMNEPVMFVGQFGAGKTAAIYQACEDEDAVCVPILLGQYDTVDLKGTPWVGGPEDFQMTIWHPASTLPFKGNPNFPTDKKIVLFLDEITSATVPVLGVCYQLVNERRVGEHELMDNVRVICAGNRENDKGIVTRMPMPLCNRMTWYEVGVEVDAWCKWATNHGLPAVGVAFMQFRKNLLCTYDPTKNDKTVATPRTWEKALRYYNADLPMAIKQASMAGAVGDGPAAEFWGFVDSWDKIAKLMPAIIKDPKKAPIPEEASLQYALAVTISGSMKSSPPNTHLLHPYLIRMSAEFTVLAWQLAVGRDPDLFDVPEFTDFSKRYKVIFD